MSRREANYTVFNSWSADEEWSIKGDDSDFTVETWRLAQWMFKDGLYDLQVSDDRLETNWYEDQGFEDDRPVFELQE